MRKASLLWGGFFVVGVGLFNTRKIAGIRWLSLLVTLGIPFIMPCD